MILFIDTTDNDLIKISLQKGKKFFRKQWRTKQLSETLLPAIEKLLKGQNATFKNLEKIVVVRGPGFFSRVRTGVVVANALAYSLGLPVAGVKKGSKHLKFTNSTLPYYEKAPNITKPKRR